MYYAKDFVIMYTAKNVEKILMLYFPFNGLGRTPAGSAGGPIQPCWAAYLSPCPGGAGGLQEEGEVDSERMMTITTMKTQTTTKLTKRHQENGKWRRHNYAKRTKKEGVDFEGSKNAQWYLTKTGEKWRCDVILYVYILWHIVETRMKTRHKCERDWCIETKDVSYNVLVLTSDI